jgi:hypothetical protein
MINNALNKTCNGLDIPEFHTRTGFYIDEMQKLLDEVNSILNNLDKI